MNINEIKEDKLDEKDFGTTNIISVKNKGPIKIRMLLLRILVKNLRYTRCLKEV